jgi:hypothetical protein
VAFVKGFPVSRNEEEMSVIVFGPGKLVQWRDVHLMFIGDEEHGFLPAELNFYGTCLEHVTVADFCGFGSGFG